MRTRSATTTQDGPFCPFSDPVISQSSNPTFAPTPVADGWEFEDSNGYGKGFRMPEFLHEVSRGGLTWVAEVRFDADPTTRGDEMQVFQFRTPTEDRTAGVYTNSGSGNLEFKVCIDSGCERVATSAPTVGVWMTVAARYVHSDRRMELWVDGRLASWADTLAARAQVRQLSPVPCWYLCRGRSHTAIWIRLVDYLHLHLHRHEQSTRTPRMAGAAARSAVAQPAVAWVLLRSAVISPSAGVVHSRSVIPSLMRRHVAYPVRMPPALVHNEQRSVQLRDGSALVGLGIPAAGM